MALVLGAADGPGSHLFIAGAVEVGVFIDHALLQGGGQDDGFESGAGLVGVGDRPVGPLGVLGLLEGRGVGLLIGGGVVLHRLQIGRQDRVGDGPGVVEVVVGGGGHGQDGPRLGVHDDAEAAVADLVGGDAVGEGLLTVALDGGVDGELDVEARLGVHVALVAGEHLGAVVLLGGDHPAGLPRQLALILGLDAVGAPVAVVDVDPADDLGGQGAVGVDPLGVGQEVDPGIEAVLLLEGPDGLGDAVVHPPLEDLVLGGGVLHALEDGVGLHPQDLRQALGHELLVPAGHGGALRAGELFALGRLLLPRLGLGLLRRQDVLGGDDHVVDVGGHGQDIPLGIVDGAPGGGDQHVSGLLADGLLLVEAVVHDLDLPQLPQQGDKGHHAEHRHQKDGAAQDGPVLAAVGAALLVSALFLCHALLLLLRMMNKGVRKALFSYALWCSLWPPLSHCMRGLSGNMTVRRRSCPARCPKGSRPCSPGRSRPRCRTRRGPGCRSGPPRA